MGEKRKITTGEEAPERPQKAPRLDVLAEAGAESSAAAPLELSESPNSPSAGEVEVTTSHSTSDIEPCEHLLLDSEDLGMLVFDIKTGERLWTCQDSVCRGSAAGGKVLKMVCLVCYSSFCTQHSQLHAKLSHHWVALLYDTPYVGYCYLCERVLKLGEDNWKEDEWEMATSKDTDEQEMVASNTKDERRIVAGDDVCSYIIRGMPNLGFTCYMNAVLQCLLALGKLRTMILRPDARLGTIGQYLQQLFVETSSANDAARLLDPDMLLDCMRMFNQEFRGKRMHDSHDFLTSLRYALDEEVMELNRLHTMQGGAVFPTIGQSIFKVQLCQTISCKSCSNNSVQHVEFDDLQAAVPQPSKDPPARSVAPPPRITSLRSPRKPHKKLFQHSDKNDGEKIQTIPESGDSQIPGSELRDVAMEKNPKPLQVNFAEVKDVVHDHFKTQKNDVPGEVIEVPIKVLDFIPKLFDDSDSKEIGESTVGFRNPKDIGQPPLGNIEAKEYAFPVEVSKEDKGKPCKKLFQQSDKNDGEKIHTIPESSDSQVPGSELGDVAMEKNPKRLQVDCTEVKDVVHDQKNDVPGEVIGVTIKVLNFIPKLFDDSDSEEMGASTIGFRNPKDIGQPSLRNIEAKEYAFSAEVTKEDKGKAQSSDIIHDVAEHINSLSTIEDCLALLLIDQPVEWTCGNCSKVNRTKNGEQMMANTNVNTAVGGDQTEQSDGKTCPSEQSSELNSLSVGYSSPSRQPHNFDAQGQVILSGDSTTEDTSGTICGEEESASKKPASPEGVQEAVPKCLPTEKQTNQLSAQDSQDTSTQNQGCGTQVKLDDHSGKQVEENQTEQKDGNGGATQTILLTNLPPVIIIQLKRFVADISKLRGHVSFKEILDVGPFVHPSCVDKDNTSYRLVGVVEHLGPLLNGGHYIAYVRAGCNQQSSGSSSWVCANDHNITEVSLQEVLRCEAYILFYERMDGGSTSGNSTQQLTSSAMTKEAEE